MEMARSQRRLRPCCRNDSRLMKLPTEILDSIHLSLPITSLICLRCVSKTSKNRVDCPCFCTLHTQRLLSAQAASLSISSAQVPLLMLMDHFRSVSDSGFAFRPLQFKYNGSNATLTRSKHAAVYEIRSTSLNAFYSLDFVFYNLFFFRDDAYNYPGRKRMDRSPCFLFNPLKGEVLPLPTTDILIPNYDTKRSIIKVKEWFAMGFDDATNTYKIVRVSGDQKSMICKLMTQIYVMGTSSWREIPSVPPCNLSNSRTFAYGDEHWLVCLPDPSLSSYGGVVSICSFNFRKEEFYWRTIPLPEHMHNKYVRCMDIPEHLHLLSLRGSLATVDTSSDDYNIEIWVLKNYDKKEWILDYKIDKSVLSGKFTNLICCEWEHGIYFTLPRLREFCRGTFFVDLRCGSVKHVELVPPRTSIVRKISSILSYTGTLISLKEYGSLVEPEPTTTGSIRSLELYDSGEIRDEAARGKDFIYLKR